MAWGELLLGMVGEVATLPRGNMAPKPSAEEAAPLDCYRKGGWDCWYIVSLASRSRGAQASQHGMLLGFLQTFTPAVKAGGRGRVNPWSGVERHN